MNEATVFWINVYPGVERLKCVPSSSESGPSSDWWERVSVLRVSIIVVGAKEAALMPGEATSINKKMNKVFVQICLLIPSKIRRNICYSSSDNTNEDL